MEAPKSQETISLELENESKKYTLKITNTSSSLLINISENGNILNKEYSKDFTLSDLTKIPNAKFLPVLSARCQEILKWRYGQMDGIRRTLREVGDMYEVASERIRQLEYKSLGDLSWYAKNQHQPEVKEKLRMYGIEVDDENTD